MNPRLRGVLIALSLAASSTLGWVALSGVARNVTAMRSWRKVDAWPSTDVSKGGWLWAKDACAMLLFPSPDRDAQIQAEDRLREHPQDPEARNAFVTAEYRTGLGLPSLSRTAPIYLDPADPQRALLGGFLQMWVFPVTLLACTVPFLIVLALALRLGAGADLIDADHASPQWMYSPPPPPIQGGVVLRSPRGFWKAELFWSLLGVALVAFASHPQAGFSRTKAVSALLVGALFAMTLWISAWRDATFSLTANDQGVRVITLTGWRHVTWQQVRGFERQSLIHAISSSRFDMSIPASTNTTPVYAFTDASGRTLIHFRPDLVPPDARHGLIKLCQDRAGVTLRDKNIRLGS